MSARPANSTISATASGLSRAEVLTVAFSAKESLYKALYPQVRRFFHFTDAEGHALDPAGGRLALRLLANLGGPFCRGRVLCARFAIAGSHALTAVEVSAR